MSEDQTPETVTEEDVALEGNEISQALDDEQSCQLALDDEQSSQLALDDEQSSQLALDDEQSSQLALDDERPTSRSDAKDPWHGLNDFDGE